jgi:hypothetical protein
MKMSRRILGLENGVTSGWFRRISQNEETFGKIEK